MFNGLKFILFFLLLSSFSYSQNTESLSSDSLSLKTISDSIAANNNQGTLSDSTSTTNSDASSATNSADSIPISTQSDSIPTDPPYINKTIVTETPVATNTELSTPPVEKKAAELILKPTIGLGTGMFSFYGDLYNKHFQAPMVSRIGYELTMGQNLTEYLQFNFYVLFGKLGANERFTSVNRNLNFESQIHAGGLNLTYNFGNFLPKERSASPYISLGIESFEFLTKTDLYDKYGNKYYYWTDGTTRNLDQNDANAKDSKIIRRDYIYESDVRELNIDGFEKYAERSWAIPVGAGIVFNINKYVNFKLGATMHFTFTDYIDGVTSKSTGNRAGNKQNDNYLMTSFSINYNFGNKKNDPQFNHEEDYIGVDFLALEKEDTDLDGIPDFKDSCQGTPEGVPIDVRGCPLDDDNDGVPNYKDDELNSPVAAFVDEKGVQLSDSLIAYRYNFFADSTGVFAKVEEHDHNGNIRYNTAELKEFTVELGKFKKGLAPEIMTKFLSIKDINSGNIDDSTTIYTAGKFSTYQDAEDRKKQLLTDGYTDAKIVYKQNGKYFDATGYDKSSIASTTVTTTHKDGVTGVVKNGSTFPNENNAVINTPGTVLRIQLGAFSKRMTKNVFKDIKNVVEIRTDDGLYKYVSGAFTNIDDAAKYKVEMVLKGYQGAFIIAYKDGKRISLKDAGATAQSKKDELTESPDSSSSNLVNKILITFKVQVGIFKNEPPEDKLAIFAKIENIKGESTPAGLKRYVVGSFNDYKSADALKDEIIKNYGIKDAFVIALFNNEYISVQEAMELLK